MSTSIKSRRSIEGLTSRGVRLSTSLALALASFAGFVFTAPPAHAATVVLAAAGADVTAPVMNSIFNNPAAGQYNIPTLPDTPFSVPGDANCSTTAYVQATPGPGQAIAPISAGTGLNALKANETAPAGQTGCIDIARSSAPPRGPGVGSGHLRVLRLRPRRCVVGQPEPAGAGHAVARSAPGHLQLHVHRLGPGGRRLRSDPALLHAGGIGHGQLLPVRPARWVRPDLGQHDHAAGGLGVPVPRGQADPAERGHRHRHHRLPGGDPARTRPATGSSRPTTT